MSKTIWKYNLRTTNIQQVEMPNEYEILTIQIQDGMPCIWCLVNPNAEKVKVTIEMFGTGHRIHENTNRKYIGTFQQGAFVHHCFENVK